MNFPYRQVHLDFHTSPSIPDVGIDFDPDDFVRNLQLGHVRSVTVFAKCHHGYSYYPTRVGTPHPGLKRDLLGEMITACRKAGIRVPVYTTVVWDELAWATHPEWRAMTVEGAIPGVVNTPLKAGWKNLCMNTGYGDYVIAQVEEILDRYDGDGFFIDICRNLLGLCACSTCLSQMQKEGIDPQDPDQLLRFNLSRERRFMKRLTKAIQARKPGQSIFYNSRLVVVGDPEMTNRAETDEFTHWEIESLPGGAWGYDHFPIYVRYFQTLKKPMLMMTGRFHTTWGDFGGLRNRAALEFECFQGLAHGAGCSIGDQLHPSGKMNPTVYQRIGEVYAEVERREPWCVDTRPLVDVGVLTSARHDQNGEADISAVDRGVVHVLEQLKYQFQFLDTDSNLNPYAVVIVPEDVHMDTKFADRIRLYVKQGGKLLISGCSGIDPQKSDYFLTEEMGVHYVGQALFAPDYLALGPELTDGIEPMTYVCEHQGVSIKVEPGAHVMAYSVQPYFNRTWEHFCSHQYTPQQEVTDEPVIVQKGGVITIARPLFSEYAASARRIHKLVLGNCLHRLLPAPRLGKNDLPSTAVVTVRAKNDGSAAIVHLLHYVHQRRGKILDVIEDIIPLYNVQLRIHCEKTPHTVRLVPEGTSLDFSWQEAYASFIVPQVQGYQMVEIKF